MRDVWKRCATLVVPFLFAHAIAEARVPNRSPMQEEPLAAGIDALFETWDDPASPGASVAVMRDGELLYSAGYGCAQLEYGIPIETDTVFHVASVSKQFTAMCVALLVLEGKLDLDVPLSEYVEEVPDFGTLLTLRHVLHHTSGLRDQWESLFLSGVRGEDSIRQQDILALVSRMQELNFPPGDRYMYCNTGFSLAAECVARASEQSFPDFARTQIFEPLGMQNTHVHSDYRHVVPQRAYSYARVDEGFENRKLNFSNYGATSLFSTAEDLVLWLTNFDHGQLGGEEARALLFERGVLNSGEELDYALGLSHGTHKGWKVIGHGGSDAGFRSHVVWFPDAKLAVAVLCNLGEIAPGTLARQIADLVLKGQTPPPAEPDVPDEPQQEREDPADDAPEFELSREQFNRYAPSYVGTYVGPAGSTIQLERTRTRLYLRRPGHGRNRLYPVSEHRFRSRTSGADVQLFLDASESVIALTLGVHDLQHAFVPAAGETGAVRLSEYSGRYLSEELNTYFDLEVKDGVLVAQHLRHGTFHLEATWPDEFQGQQWFFRKLRFERDAAGIVSGYRVDGSRVLNRLFTRVHGER